MPGSLLDFLRQDRDESAVVAPAAQANVTPRSPQVLLWIVGGLVAALMVALSVLAGWTVSQATSDGTTKVPLPKTSAKRDVGAYGVPVRDGQFEFTATVPECRSELNGSSGPMSTN